MEGINTVGILMKSDKIVRILKELGAKDNVELAETTLSDLNETNFNQIDANLKFEDVKLEAEMLEKDVLDRIIKETREVMIQIVDRAYCEAYYEPYNGDAAIIKI